MRYHTKNSVPGHWITALLTRYGCTYSTHIQIFHG
eukprot:SAG11_NODE_19436_length_466_cov_1.583106_1_plen_34_part_01